MMEFRILGPLEVLDEGRPIPVTGARPRTLLAILLVKANEVVSTDRLIDELWGEAPPDGAANALQATVSRLRRALKPAAGRDGAGVLTRSPGYLIAVDSDAIDASCFERRATEARMALAAGDPARAAALLGPALALWHGPALAEFGYAEFAQETIARLDELRLTAMEDRGEADLACGRHAEVLAELRALVSSHPFSERLRAHLMVALYRAGRQPEALEVYREGKLALADELGVEPGPALQQTEVAIRRNDPSLLAVPSSGPVSLGGRPTNLPIQHSSFVGRERETTSVEGLLAERQLVTLTGLGGSGKSRLALHVAADLTDEFGDGVWYADLVAVPSPRYLVHAIAAAIQFPIDSYSSDLDARSQLLDYLEPRSMLIVLDNFEHLVAGTDLLTDALARAPTVRFLVTSRTRLSLREEWVYEVAGLPYHLSQAPATDPAALRLFLDRAHQADPHLAISGEDRAAALRICSLVEGMPLGVELAAAWVSVLSCVEIAREIERSLDFLTTALRDVPPEHRSLRAAFRHSWNLLAADERAGLQKLTVFRGGFRREAASEVAGVGLPLLTALVAKSVVHREADGRYRLHELIRQYAAERLRANPQEEQAVIRRHADHYVRLLIERDRAFVGELALEARGELRPDLGNLRAAVEFAVAAWEDERALRVVRALHSFYRAHGLHEGITAFHEIAEDLEQRGADVERDGRGWRVLLAAIVNEAFCETICGVGIAEGLLRRSLPALRAEADLRPELGIALLCLGTNVDFRGELRPAVKYLEEALAILRQVGDESLIWPCLLWLGWARLELGHIRRAEAVFREAHEITARLGDLLGVAYSLSKLGTVADARGAYREGKRHHAAALEAFTRLGDKAGPGYAISRMSLSAWGMGEHVEAERLGRKGLELFGAVGHRWGIATSHCRIGFAEMAQGKLEEAQATLRTGLRYALDHGLESVALYAFIGLAGVMARGTEPGEAAQLLGFALRHPSVPAIYRTIADGELTLLKARLPGVATAETHKWARGLDLRALAAAVLDETASALPAGLEAPLHAAREGAHAAGPPVPQLDHSQELADAFLTDVRGMP